MNLYERMLNFYNMFISILDYSHEPFIKKETDRSDVRNIHVFQQKNYSMF